MVARAAAAGGPLLLRVCALAVTFASAAAADGALVTSYSSEFIDGEDYAADTTTSAAARQYWDTYMAAIGNLTGATTNVSREQRTFLNRVLLCPPYSVSSKQIRCICQLGYGCTGSSHCQRGLSNRAHRLRIEGWMIKKCTLCRCDPLDCKVHRKRCGSGCQDVAFRVNPQPSKDRYKMVAQGTSKLLCIIHFNTSLASAHELVRAWGYECDGRLLVAPESARSTRYVNGTMLSLNESDHNVYSSLLLLKTKPHETQTLHTSPNSQMKVWEHVREHYNHEYEWFLSVSDSTMVAVPNLKKYLSSLYVNKYTNESFYVGRRLRMDNGLIVNSARSGYILNAHSVDAMVEQFEASRRDVMPLYRPLECLRKTSILTFGTKRYQQCDWVYGNTSDFKLYHDISGEEFVAAHLASAGILPLDSKDAHGGERFHYHRIDDITQYTKRLKYHVFFMRTLPFRTKAGIHGVSKESVTFPALTLDEITSLDFFFKRECFASRFAPSYKDEWTVKKAYVDVQMRKRRAALRVHNCPEWNKPSANPSALCIELMGRDLARFE